jgi:hypothetical protein
MVAAAGSKSLFSIFWKLLQMEVSIHYLQLVLVTHPLSHILGKGSRGKLGSFVNLSSEAVVLRLQCASQLPNYKDQRFL